MTDAALVSAALAEPQAFCIWATDVLGFAPGELEPDTILAQEAGFDSVLVFELLVAAEEDFDVEIDESATGPAPVSVRALYDAVRASVSVRHSEAGPGADEREL